ncbi:hypothetical protein HK104_000831 [Borealophlyctis nickersoniae]|nr:hypothetical protein HK104_000831 [Borealophlyctis nickersoniae]
MDIFDSLKVYFIPTKLPPPELDRLRRSVQERGGRVVEDYKQSDVIVTKLSSVDRISKYFNMAGFETPVVKTDWVDKSVSQSTCLPFHAFTIDMTSSILPALPQKRQHSPPSPPIIVLSTSDEESQQDKQSLKNPGLEAAPKRRRWWGRGRGGSSRNAAGKVGGVRRAGSRVADVVDVDEFESLTPGAAPCAGPLDSDTDSLKSYNTSVRTSSDEDHHGGDWDVDGGLDEAELEEPAENSGTETEDEKAPWDADVPLDSRFVNSRPHPLNHANKELVDLLKLIERKRELRGEARNALSYRHAIAALISYPRDIQSWKEARKIKGIGSKIAMMIKQFLKIGTIREAESIKKDEWFRVVDTFASVYGVGPNTAREWYNKGYRSVEEVRALEKNVTKIQRIGLEMWDDFKQKMTRADVEEMLALLRETLDDVEPGCIIEPVGGYRRGKQLSGDLDVVVTHPDEGRVPDLLGKVVDRLKLKGYVKHVMWYGEGADKDTVSEIKLSGSQRGYSMDQLAKAFCAMIQPSKKIYRQVDIIISPYSVFACAVVGWSGSKQFERGLRDWCKRGTKRFHFVSHGLYDRKTNKRIDVKTERELFNVLGLPYFEPVDRNA